MESPDSLVGDIMTRTPREVTQRQLHMHTAFVLFKTEPSMERDVFMALSDMSAVTETHTLCTASMIWSFGSRRRTASL